MFVFVVPNAHAQSAPRSSIFNSRALHKAVTSKHSKNSQKRSFTQNSASSFSSTGEAFQLDTVDDILLSSDRRHRLLSEYRGLMYLRYLDDGLGNRVTDYWDYDGLAEQMFIVQGTVVLSDWIKGSPLEEFGKYVVNQLKTLRDKTTVKVSQEPDGDLRVSKIGKHKNQKDLLVFKLHASAKNGVEPRITFADAFVLRYDMFEQATLLEFKTDF